MIFKVLTDHFAEFPFSTCSLKPSYRVGNGSEEWAIFKVFTDHFAHFLYSTSNLKSSYRVGSGYEEWANSMTGLPIK